jgi:predicted TIM-barrel fold metal-dependent hydrolase
VATVEPRVSPGTASQQSAQRARMIVATLDQRPSRGVVRTHTEHPMSRSAADIRADLGHPVVDADGHWLETVPVFLDYFRDQAGPEAAGIFAQLTGHFYDRWHAATPAERHDQRLPRAPWWAEPADTLDRATATLPGLLSQRLDEFGIDVALMYPSIGLFGLTIQDDDVSAAFARAANRLAADAFAPHADRLIPVALVPQRNPHDAIEALDDAMALGFRAIFTTGAVRRTTSTASPFIDFLALDSAYDYDPFWQRCRDLGVAVTVHGGSIGWPDRLSPTNSVFNHVGHFGNASQGFAKALVLGGVLRRFPDLRFAFLEGGVAWGSQLLADLVGHWDKRNLDAVLANLRPANIDREELRALFSRYGGPMLRDRFDEFIASPSMTRPFTGLDALTDDETDLDEFAAADIRDPADLAEWFRERFFFGCESDDPMVVTAFDARGGVPLRAMFGSDIGHFDVPDMQQVLPEAFELVERGDLTAHDFEQFVFTNIVRLHTANNPQFFAGTIVADDVDSLARRQR